MSQSRQLAAIMFTDIVGYTSLMGKDEDIAFQSLSQFKNIVKPLVENYEGRWHKDLGDGAIMSFSNVLDAVHCAISIQKEINAKTDFWLRMGVHLGDVTFKDGDVFGDGVNIASRIQHEAPEGGICISEAVFKNINNQVGIKAGYLGRKKLKNVTEPLRLYQILAEGVKTKTSKKARAVSLPLCLGLIAASSLLTFLLIKSLQPITTTNQQSGNKENAVNRFVIDFPENAPLALTGSGFASIRQTALALSPDASLLVYVAATDSINTKLYLHPMDGFSFSPMPGTEGAYSPFFSPDGQWVGFISENKLKKISVKGGSPVNLCDVSITYGAIWTEDDRIIFANNHGERLMQVSANGGKADLLFSASKEPDVGWLMWPSFLPGNNKLIYGNLETFFVSDVVSGETKNLPVSGTYLRYLPSGYLVYADYGRLLAVKFDVEQLKVIGSPFPVIEPLRTEIFARAAQFSFANNGTMIYVPGPAASVSKFFWVDRKGKTDTVFAHPDVYGMFTLSPDGNKIAFGKWVADSRIGIIDLQRNNVTEFPTDAWDKEPIWSPDGNWLAYSSKEETKYKIKKINLSRINKPEVLMETTHLIRPYSFTRDGKAIAFFQFALNRPDIQKISLDSLGKVETLIGAMPYACYGASFSHDQRYFVYNSDESGRYEVYVQPYPTTGERWQITTNNGKDAIWSPKGNEIFYRTSYQLFSIEVNTDSGFSFKKPQMIFQGHFLDVPQRSFDVNPDSQRFLMLSPVSKEITARRAIVVTNWFEEVKRLAPVK